MKLRIAAIAILCIGLFCGYAAMNNQVYAQGKAKAADPKMTVLNPMGTPPPVTVKQMAPRMDTMDGKTIYFVNTDFPGTEILMPVLTDWFKANYPKTNVVIKRSGGGMDRVDKALWAEIGEKGDAAIFGLGH
jgi:hypothetical protein